MHLNKNHTNNVPNQEHGNQREVFFRSSVEFQFDSHWKQKFFNVNLSHTVQKILVGGWNSEIDCEQ